MTDRAQVEEDLRQILEDEFGVVAPKLGDSFVQDMAMDSIDLAELILSIEDRFGVDVPARDADAAATLDDAIRLVARLTKEGA